MKIAVTYENGAVFQHFGKTEAFKVYEAENGNVLSSEVIGTDGNGHEALADFLAAKGVNTVICGGLGDGAQAALAAAGIEVYSGAQGDADAAVEALLRGELESKGVNCDHHGHEEEEEGCGGGCGGCEGGCGGCVGCHIDPDFEGPNVGKMCRVNYRGTFDDGTEFDSSYGRGEPLEFICGAGMMIHGFDKAVAGMEVGQKLTVRLTPEEAYGREDPRAIYEFELAKLPGAETLNVGEQAYLYDSMGNPVPVKVLEKTDTMIKLDANHEMAGKELIFEIELLFAE